MELRAEKTKMTKSFFTKLMEKGFQLKLLDDIPDDYKTDDIQIWSATRKSV